jgi:hypothetical protein
LGGGELGWRAGVGRARFVVSPVPRSEGQGARRLLVVREALRSADGDVLATADGDVGATRSRICGGFWWCAFEVRLRFSMGMGENRRGAAEVRGIPPLRPTTPRTKTNPR